MQVVIFVLYVLVATLQGLGLSFYIYFEIKNESLHVLRTNKFVGLAIMENFIFSLNLIGQAVLVRFPNLALYSFCFVCGDFAVACHLVLIYLRSAALFQMSRPMFVKLVNVLIVVAITMSLIATVMRTINVSITSTFSLTYAGTIAPVTSCLGSLSAVVVDMICTLRFARLVQETNAAQVEGSRFRGKDARLRNFSTTLIAKRSAQICLLALLSVILSIIYVLLTVQLPGLFLVQQCLFAASAMLWMWMKIELDSWNKSLPESMMGHTLMKSLMRHNECDVELK
eukprot:TRINITY_DN21687_c0_g1_i1.p1 TRINITY_DN21687_c0_g1~~TRINITY_DN21687_c0_g1_i1.p1  ORF type:complete len:284 (-),score=40.04 TRINITY_DN21687_c0_g1_i1:122-973(-)